MVPNEAERTRLHVILTCFNRREMTLRAVRSVSEGAIRAGINVDFTIYDDGSSDGTYEALKQLGGEIHVIRGTGDAYWARGMEIAERDVRSRSGSSDRSALLWLNDDVVLDRDCFEQLSDAMKLYPDAILVGAMRDPESAEMTYSGMVRDGLPASFRVVPPSGGFLPVDTFNGNLVVIPAAVSDRVGTIDGRYAHAFADVDFGVRARRCGVPVLLMPRTLGACARNPRRPRGRILDDWRHFLSRKGGGNFRSLRRLTRTVAPRSHLLYLIAIYAKWWANRLTPARNSTETSGT